MDLIAIPAKMREKTGKGVARKLRKNGWLPANVIEKAQGTSIEINAHELPKVMRGGDKKCILDFGEKKQTVRVQEVQVHPSKRVPIHVDFIPEA